MPVYEYAHTDASCPLGVEFEITQPIREEPFKVCPQCGQPVQRLISRTFISVPQSNSDLKNLGFTKLVKRDTGVYENVTRSGQESRYMEAGKPETIPDLTRKIED